MCTAYSSPIGGVSIGGVWTETPPRQRSPWTETLRDGYLPPEGDPPEQRLPRRNMGPGTETPRRTIGPGSQIGSDIIQTPPLVNRMTHGSKNITLSQTSFAGGKNQSFEESCPLLETIDPQSLKHSRGLKQRLLSFKATTLLIQPSTFLW